MTSAVDSGERQAGNVAAMDLIAAVTADPAVRSFECDVVFTHLEPCCRLFPRACGTWGRHSQCGKSPPELGIKNVFGDKAVPQSLVRTIRLLVVEDSAGYRHLIKTTFERHHARCRWDVATVSSGEEALQLLFSEEAGARSLPDLVLLDWNLPKISGNQVLQRMKEHPRLVRIPVLVFSSSSAEQDIHEAYGLHANGYITKPGTIELMEEVVEAIARFWAATAQLPGVIRSQRA